MNFNNVLNRKGLTSKTGTNTFKLADGETVQLFPIEEWVPILLPNFDMSKLATLDEAAQDVLLQDCIDTGLFFTRAMQNTTIAKMGVAAKRRILTVSQANYDPNKTVVAGRNAIFNLTVEGVQGNVVYSGKDLVEEGGFITLIDIPKNAFTVTEAGKEIAVLKTQNPDGVWCQRYEFADRKVISVFQNPAFAKDRALQVSALKYQSHQANAAGVQGERVS